jgi:hypothetical protein
MLPSSLAIPIHLSLIMRTSKAGDFQTRRGISLGDDNTLAAMKGPDMCDVQTYPRQVLLRILPCVGKGENWLSASVWVMVNARHCLLEAPACRAAYLRRGYVRPSADMPSRRL